MNTRKIDEPEPQPSGHLVLYEDKDGGVRLDVQLAGDTLWLDAHQMAILFGRDRSVIVRHLRNIYASKELDVVTTCAKIAQVATDGKVRQMDKYNLDAILSVGYRVNSKRGTQFRIWATSVLRDHLIKGYSANQHRLSELNQAVRLISDIAQRRVFSGDEATALLQVVSDYSFALDLLDEYDHQRVRTPSVRLGHVQPLEYDEAIGIVAQLRSQFGPSSLFGVEKDHGLKSALGAIMQSFGGRDVYPSLEEKAAHLLYFLVKNHAFVDGNKRIGAALFLWFLDKNDCLYDLAKNKRIADNTLVAMTLLIAESKPPEKDILCRVLVNLISHVQEENRKKHASNGTL